MKKEDLEILRQVRSCLGNVRDYLHYCEPLNPPWDPDSQWDECHEALVALHKLIKRIEPNT